MNQHLNPKVWLATRNSGKLTEVRQLLSRLWPEAQLLSLADVPAFSSPPETGKDFLENARIKAKSLHSVKPTDWVLGEDSGLEVAGLGGLPGVHSARYAGERASDSENVAKVLKMLSLKNPGLRDAKFVCSLVVYTPNGEEWVFRGECAGSIAAKPAGKLGFGYDPVFVPQGQSQTLAELGPGLKNQISHRAHAISQWLQKKNS